MEAPKVVRESWWAIVYGVVVMWSGDNDGGLSGQMLIAELW